MPPTKQIRPAHLVLRPMQVADQQEVAKLFCLTFQREPLGAHSGVEDAEGEWIAKKALQDANVSFVVEDPTLPQGKRLVAFLASYIMTAASLQKADAIMEATDPVQGFLNQVLKDWQAKSTIFEKNPQAKIMKLMAIGVDIPYEGMGLSKDLLALSMERTRELACEAMLVTASAFATQHLFGNRLGFERMVQVPYGAYEWEGRHPFHDLVEPEFLEVYEKKMMATA